MSNQPWCSQAFGAQCSCYLLDVGRVKVIIRITERGQCTLLWHRLVWTVAMTKLCGCMLFLWGWCVCFFIEVKAPGMGVLLLSHMPRLLLQGQYCCVFLCMRGSEK